MVYTGGELNALNGEFGISAPNNSVPVMKLIQVHKPKSRDALYQLIKYHYEKNCSCGIKSKGTVEDFGKNLYDVQLKKWGKYKYSLRECIQWEYDLFINQSLKGFILEDKALKILQKELKNFIVKKAKGYIDEELRVDLIIYKDNRTICGIQVKPNTFKYVRNNVIQFNKNANKKWHNPVYYLFYNKSEEFLNLKIILNKIMQNIKN